MYLNEVGIKSSQQYSFKQLILVAVLVAERSGMLAFTGLRHHLGFMQVPGELRDETCSMMESKSDLISQQYTVMMST